MATTAWALSIGLVLADSSIVTLALPDILSEYDSGVFAVSWVLTAYNLFLALAILPLARRNSKRPASLWRWGVAGFAVSSAVCALAPSLEVLIAARCAQALGGAAAIAGAIELLARAAGSHEGGARLWGVAGTAGLALGPAAGGVLTELLSWQAIFLAQIPLLLVMLAVRQEPAEAVERGPEGKLDLNPEWALGFLSAGLTAALFLLVILLINGWGLSPIGAALVVSVIPAATLAFSRLHMPRERAGALAVAGAIATAGGLAALGLLPGASAELTIAPQLLIGAGLALAVPTLTAAALLRRDPEGTRAAATIGARHGGIVLGLLLLTPVLSLQLTSQQDAARDAGTALLLDAPLPPTTKIALAGAIEEEIDRAEQHGALPDIDRAFGSAQAEADGEDGEDLGRLHAAIDDQLERAATHAFSLPFLGAALLAGLALIPLRSMRREET